MEFRGEINLINFEGWALRKLNHNHDSKKEVKCKVCDGTGEVLVDIDLPSGRWVEVEDECLECDGTGFIDISEIDDKDCTSHFTRLEYRNECSETVRLLSQQTKTDFFENLCKAKGMHYGW